MERIFISVGDQDSTLNKYYISLYNYNNEVYTVFAECEQDALDILVDYLEDVGNTAYFYSQSLWDEIYEDNIEPIIAGNHCLLLDPSHTRFLNL